MRTATAERSTGVGDDGTVPGVEDADGCALQVSNMVRDAVRPDVTMFVSYETLNCDGKAVVAVKVQRGTNRPYYMAKKGLRPEGVYVRRVLLRPGDRCGHPADDQGDRRRQLRGHALPRPRAHL